MCSIAQTAAHVDVRLCAIARPTQQREAGKAPGNPQFPAAFFFPSKLRASIAPESLSIKAQMTFSNYGEVLESAETLGASESVSNPSRL